MTSNVPHYRQIIDYQVTNNKQLHFYNTFHNLQQIIQILAPDTPDDSQAHLCDFDLLSWSNSLLNQNIRLQWANDTDLLYYTTQ